MLTVRFRLLWGVEYSLTALVFIILFHANIIKKKRVGKKQISLN